MKVYEAFRHVWAVGELAKRQSDAQAKKAFRQMVGAPIKAEAIKADKKK